MANSKKEKNTPEFKLDEIKLKLAELNSVFGSLEIDDVKLGEIMAQRRAKEIDELVQPVVERTFIF